MQTRSCSKQDDAEETAEETAWGFIRDCRDPSWIAEEWISELKGRGVITTKEVRPGTFMVQYPGELITAREGKRREKQIHSVFRFFFSWKGKNLCVDATPEPVPGCPLRLGRLVNHSSQRERNCKVEVVPFQGQPYLCLVSTREIPCGTELLFDYGFRIGKEPWNQVEMEDITSEPHESPQNLGPPVSAPTASAKTPNPSPQQKVDQLQSPAKYPEPGPVPTSLAPSPAAVKRSPSPARRPQPQPETSVPSTSSQKENEGGADEKKESAEAVMLRLERSLKQSLAVEKPKHNACLTVLKEIGQLIPSMTLALLKRHMGFVESIKKIRNYKHSAIVRGEAVKVFKELKCLQQKEQDKHSHRGTSLQRSVSEKEFDNDEQSTEVLSSGSEWLPSDIPPSDSDEDEPLSQTLLISSRFNLSELTNSSKARSSCSPPKVQKMSMKTEKDEKVNTRYIKPNRSCPFCHKSCGEKLSRHICKVHKDEKEVQRAMKLPKKEKVRALAEFKKQGILHRNRKCAKEEEEPVYQRERCTGKKDALIICGICKGFYAKKYFSRHHKMCRGDTAIPSSSVSASLLSTDPNTEVYCQGFASEILSKIKDDEIGETCKKDPVIRIIGMRLWDKSRGKADKKTEVRKSVRSNMRRLAALYLTFKETHEMHNNDKELKQDNAGDLFDRTNFQVLAESIRTFTLDSETGKLKPGLKIGVYYLLKKAATITKATYLANAQDDKSTEIEKFLEVLKLNENLVFGDATYSLNKNRQINLRKPQQLPLEEDVEKIRTHTLQEMEAMVNDKHLFWDSHQFVRLRDLTVSRLTLFNARRGGEPCRLIIEEWKDAENGAWVDQHMAEEVTDPVERQLLDQIKICYQTGKGNNHLVSVLFPNDTLPAMNILCDPEVRSTAQINVANPYIFASTKGSEEHFSGWHALNNVCENAAVKDKERLNATRNRHRVSTIYAALELPPEERALFYTHMGHSEDINKNVYQTPMAIQEITKVGKTLQRIDGKGGRQPTNGVGKQDARQTSQEFAVNSGEDTISISTMPGPAPKRSKVEKGRSYTSWHKKDTKLVLNYFVDIIRGESSRSIPGEQECETFLRKTGLMVEWTAVRNKVMNERVKWHKRMKQRLDDLGLES